MSYKKSQLHVSELTGAGPGGLHYSGGMRAAGILYLEHECDEWTIGTPADARRLRQDLRTAIKTAEGIRRRGPRDPVLAKIAAAGWQYYCHICKNGFASFYGSQGSTVHAQNVHGQQYGTEFDRALDARMNYPEAQ